MGTRTAPDSPRSSQRGSISAAHVPAWLVLLVALSVSALTSATVIALHTYADRSRQAEVVLVRIHQMSRQLISVEWHAEAEDAMTDTLSAEASWLREHMSLALLELAELDPSSSTPGLVHAAYSRYETDVFTLFQLFASGDRAAAHEWDEQQVDPSYNTLLDLLFEAGRKYAAEADRANLVAAGGSVLTMLAAGVLTAIAFWYAQRTRRAFECELARRAFHDALTGLPNRAQFGDRLSAALALAATRNERLAVLFVDVDAFKQVNDDLGHAAGDQLLVEVAQRLGGVLRSGDMAARLGGDEFTLLLQPPIQQVDAEHVAQRIIDTLHAPFRLAGRDARVTVSVGIALSGDRAAGGERVEDLVRTADHAMYLSKRRGKGRWEVAEVARADQTAA